jgi:uncharacterized protein (TIGR03435 family)
MRDGYCTAFNADSGDRVHEIIGFPTWVMTEKYDVAAKPAPGAAPTAAERAQMIRNLLIDRMKLARHVEEQERTTFALVVARRDGRLGSQLKRSTLDCAAQRAATPPSPIDVANRCGRYVGSGWFESGGTTLDGFADSLTRPAGGFVRNRTGLDGYYAVSLRYALPRLNADGSASVDDAPQFVTALQEQLGLKLVPEKTKVRIFVVDHIERPTPD